MVKEKNPIVEEEDFLNTYKLEKFGLKASEKLDVDFPIYSDLNLAKIVSYLTFDGHLTVEKSMFYMSAGRKAALEDFAELIKKKFNTEGRIESVNQGWGTSFCYRVFSKPIARILKLSGTPTGDKIVTKFNVPGWILDNKDYSKAYLQVAFYCEEFMWDESENVTKIRFRMVKSSEIIENGLHFFENMKEMLEEFGIKTTKIWTRDLPKRNKDNVQPKTMNFQINSESIETFLGEIGFINGKY